MFLRWAIGSLFGKRGRQGWHIEWCLSLWLLSCGQRGYAFRRHQIITSCRITQTSGFSQIRTSGGNTWLVLCVANVPVVSVNADAPYANFGELLEAMKGGNVTVGTAGVNSSGGMALAAIKEAAGGELGARAVTYDGGNPAVLAAASGEVVATTQLAVEQTEMIRAGKLRTLAVLSDKALTVEGIDPIPPITNWLADMPVAPDYFGVFIPAGAPQEVYDTMDKVWAEQVMNSKALAAYALERGADFDPSYGDKARERAMPVVIAEACARVTRGEAVVKPSEIGISCPAE